MEIQKNWLFSIGVLSVLGFAVLSVAPDITITPSADSATKIAESECINSTGAVKFRFVNNARQGALCWYYLDDDKSTMEKLTDICVRQRDDLSRNASIPMTGTGKTKIQLECYSFGTSYSDDCVSYKSYDDAVAQAYKAGGEGLIEPRYAETACTEILFSLTATPSSATIKPGKSAEISLSIANNGKNTYYCSAQSQDGTRTLDKAVLAGETESITIKARSSYTAPVTCKDNRQGGKAKTHTALIDIKVVSDSLQEALTNAETAIAEAEPAIADAVAKIDEAEALGADAEEAKVLAAEAQSLYDSANTKLDSANAESSKSSAENSYTDAINAKTKALDAYNSAVKAIEAKAAEAAKPAAEDTPEVQESAEPEGAESILAPKSLAFWAVVIVLFVVVIGFVYLTKGPEAKSETKRRK